MGFDCDAVTLIGLRLPYNVLYMEKLEVTHLDRTKCKNFQQRFPFCPDCGEKSSITVHKSIRNPLFTFDDFGIVDNIRGIPVYFTQNERDPMKYLYIYIYMGEKKGPRSYDPDTQISCNFSLEDLCALKNNMKNVLSDTDLFAKGNFGIYTLLNYSY